MTSRTTRTASKRLGVARILYPSRYTAARVKEQLRELLTRDTYANRAQAVGAMLQAERGVDAACDEILALHARASAA